MALLLDRGDCDHCRTFHARATSYFRISASATQHEHFGPCSRCRSEQCGSRIVHNAPPLKTTNYPRARLASSATRARTEEVETAWKPPLRWLAGGCRSLRDSSAVEQHGHRIGILAAQQLAHQDAIVVRDGEVAVADGFELHHPRGADV